ncbi:hypothetical protein [Spirochaeta dissipatitropha]
MGTKGDPVHSFSQNVREVTFNARLPGSKIESTYSIHQKIVDNQLLTRLDFEADPTDNFIMRSVILNEEEIIIFDRNSSEVFYREVLDDGHEVSDADSVGLFQRIPLEEIQHEFNRLQYRLLEDPVSGTLTVELPVDELRAEIGEQLLSHRLFFSITDQVYTGDETVVRIDGVTETTTTSIEYQEFDGLMIPIRETMAVAVEDEKVLDISDRTMPWYESIDDIEEITEEQLNEFIQAGYAIYDMELSLGDPSSLNSTTYYIREYDDIRLNNVQERYFRLF